MINERIEQLLLLCDDSLIISADLCATVREENNVLHALMLLSTVGHSEIPVLNKDRQIVGLINMPLILQGIKTDTRYLWDRLEKLNVRDVMCKKVGIVRFPIVLEDVLHELVNHNFVSVANKEGVFQGIITRKELLSRINFLAHQMDRYFDINLKQNLNGSVDRDLAIALGYDQSIFQKDTEG